MDDVVTSIYSALEQEKASSLIMNNTTATVTSLNMAVHLALLSEDVVDLNDKAVACMIKKDFQGALETLQLALAKLTALQARPSLPALPVSLTQAQDEGVNPIASIPLTATNNDDDNDVNHETNSHHQDGIFVVFNRALLIPRHHNTYPLQQHCEHQDLEDLVASPKNQNRALATVLFNIALVYHMEANRRGCDTALFGHALNYYGWSYYVIESTSAQYGFQDVLLLLLALFNNMGQIHANVFVNTEKTRQCMKWMQSTFASKSIKRVLFPEDYKFFFQYISVVSQRQLLLAPAA